MFYFLASLLSLPNTEVSGCGKQRMPPRRRSSRDADVGDEGEFWRVLAFAPRVAYKSRRRIVSSNGAILLPFRRGGCRSGAVLMRMPAWWIGGSGAQKMPRDVSATLADEGAWKNCWDGLPWLKVRRAFKTVNK